MTKLGKPLAGKVLVKPEMVEEKTANGIIIPDTAKEKPFSGTIVEVGEAKKNEVMEVSVGGTILYGKYSGTEVLIGEETYLIMEQNAILLIIK